MKKIPVYIISGFLGSGKTTVLLNMVKACKRNNEKPAIILNELGEVNVEKHLFENENVEELLNGCICCTIRNGLKETLNKFIEDNQKQKIDVLIIEGTGVANPIEIENTLNNPIYSNQFELRSMISLVDASMFLSYRSIFSSTAEVRKLLREQISSATIVLLNKIDIVPMTSLVKIEKKIKESVIPGISIFKTKYGVIPIEELFLKRYIKHDSPNQIEANTGRIAHSHNHSTINALKIDELPEMNRIELENWLKSLPNTVLRGKGIIKLKGRSGLYNFQFSAGNLVLERIRKEQSVHSNLVLIGDGLNKEEVLQNFSTTFN